MGKPAFAAEANGYAAYSAAKALWWAANQAAARALMRPDLSRGRPGRAEPGENHGVAPEPSRPAPDRGLLRRRWLEAFTKDRRDIAAGLYPMTEQALVDPRAAWRTSADFLSDARDVEARRRRDAGTEARADTPSAAYPTYYRQNFHFQSGGWFTRESAARYEAQVEALFAGAAGPMRRRTLSLLARTWRGRDQRELRVLDLACGSGAFLRDLRGAFPRAAVFGLDLSEAYLGEAREASGAAVVQANAERLPFADASLDAVTCVYLFHELPPKVRPVVAAEIARVLKPGGVFAFADSLQVSDEPGLARLLEAFPAFFHEPYYESYQTTDLAALFGGAALALRDADEAFLTKALLFAKPYAAQAHPNSSV